MLDFTRAKAQATADVAAASQQIDQPPKVGNVQVVTRFDIEHGIEARFDGLERSSFIGGKSLGPIGDDDCVRRASWRWLNHR